MRRAIVPAVVASCLVAATLVAQAPAALEPLERARAALAQIEGEIVLDGLTAPVEVLRDRWGIPHIYATTEDDLFFAQGFVAAQDRLWQMEIWRRTAEGTLAEVVGPEAVTRDTFARLLRYRGDMDAEWRSYAPNARRIVEAFVRGINAQIAVVLADPARLPVEFQLTGTRPAPWTPEVVVGRMAGYVMTRNARTEIQRAVLARQLGVGRVAEFMPHDPPVPLVVPDGLDLADISADILQMAADVSEPVRFDRRLARAARSFVDTPAWPLAPRAVGTALAAARPAPPDDEYAVVGSNNWVVAGRRSATAAPLLANDPHRAIQLPSLRYAVHLNGPGWNVIGAGEPALPGVAVGHNDRVAFGFTIVGIDQQDLYVERLDPANSDRYLYQGQWEPMRVERETLRVYGEAQPRSVELRFTRHGPVVHVDRTRHRAYALRWVGQEPGAAGYLASLSLNTVRNWDEFVAALDRWKVPSENLLYADVDGNIGWVAAGMTPIRQNWHGLLPVPGHEGKYEWEGFRSVTELPRAFNPPSGHLATANHNVLPPGYTTMLGYEWAPPHRFQRIEQVLASRETFSVAEFEALQHDELSLPARTIVEALEVAVLQRPTLDDDRALAARMLTRWDGRLSWDSAPAALYQLWLPHLRRAFQEAYTARADRAHAPPLMPLEILLERLARARARDYEVLTGDALDRAMADARAQMGSDVSEWKWGTLHRAHFEHPLASTDAERAVFNLPDVPRGGDQTTVNNTGAAVRQVHGASFRAVMDVADWDRSTMTNVPGQSAQPASPHYGDLLPLWARGQYHPMLFSREAVERYLGHHLRLVPPGWATGGPTPAAAAGDVPTLPPFAGTLVNFDRAGGRVAACAEMPGGGDTTIGARSVRRTKVWVIEREVLRELGSTPGSCDPAWSPDGSRLAVVVPNGLWTYSPTLEDPRQIAAAHLPVEPAHPHDYTAFSRPRWSPDGLRLAFLVTDGQTTWVEAVQVATGRRLFKSDPDTYSFEWTTDPRELKVGARTIRLP
ncbi:MAG: penicillin acylase family protein [Acidobacteria bacterium]|nr:penicillin acylase family protein [Acidobacteriota bacterium]